MSFDPTSPDWRTQALELRRARARAGVVPVRGDHPGRAWTLTQIGAGWPVYSTGRRYDNDAPVGGVVVDVLPAYTDPDGEIVPTRYRVLDPSRPAHPWHTLTATEIDTTALEGVGRRMSTGAVYWLLAQIPANRHVLAPADVDHLRDAHLLGAAIVTL